MPPKEYALTQGIDLLVRPRFTRVVDFSEEKLEIHGAYELISESEDRNRQIIEDVRDCIREGRTPVVLTRLKKHAKLLYDSLSDAARHVFLLYGDNTQNRNQEIRREMLEAPRDESMLLITLQPDCVRFGGPIDVQMMIDGLRKAGISVSLTGSESEHFAVIDKKLVWHGGMNLLGKEDAWDNLIRVESVKTAAELPVMAKKQTEQDGLHG